MSTQPNPDDDHGRSQAKAQLESIIEMVEALSLDEDEIKDRIEELRSEREGLLEQTLEHGDLPETHAGLAAWDASDEAQELKDLETKLEDCDRDDAQQTIHDDPLSVQVRSDWYTPGSEPEAPAEFEILLCTGGPAVRIRGELSEHCEPTRCWMEYQDWGTPWTQYFVRGDDMDAMLTYCQQFYFGE